jgi:hypothetical protein
MAAKRLSYELDQRFKSMTERIGKQRKLIEQFRKQRMNQQNRMPSNMLHQFNQNTIF